MKVAIAAPLLLTTLAAPAFAADYLDSAPVVSSVPMYQTVAQPQQQCWSDSVTTYEEHRSPAGVLIGGVTGGLLGNTIGRGNGRVAATVVGAMVGAVVGDNIANRDNQPVAVTRPVERCQTVQSYRQVLTGYQVTYNYNGRNTTVVLPYDPGPRVPVEVGIRGIPAGTYVAPAAANVVYERPAPIWEQTPYKRPRPADWEH
ncbi:MAG TPA: glycine zipper 2TM domain-containing protein [Burkholderiales bacterium]|nr:glycine zipper 2TM domain-containing protein [Burkholderiales bacterium]